MPKPSTQQPSDSYIVIGTGTQATQPTNPFGLVPPPQAIFYYLLWYFYKCLFQYNLFYIKYVTSYTYWDYDSRNQIIPIMKLIRSQQSQEINSSSTADIAFLLLIFFLVTTTIATDKGLLIMLPPKVEGEIKAPVKTRNLFKIYLNSQDRLMVKGEIMDDPTQIRPMIKEFVLNYGADPNLSDSPNDAVVSYRTDRGTTYSAYIKVLDEIQGAYYEIYGERIGLSAGQFRNLDLKDPDQKRKYENAREGIPMNISIAEPSKIGG